MGMDVKHCLPGITSVIHDQAEAAADAMLAGQISGLFDNSADQICILIFY